VAGGIILFLLGLQMLFGKAEGNAGSPEAGRDLAVFPMAVPSITDQLSRVEANSKRPLIDAPKGAKPRFARKRAKQER